MYSLPKLLLLFHRSVVSDSLLFHGQHARLPCPSPSPRVCSDSCPLSQFISFSATFSFCLQLFPVIRFFPSELALCVRWPKYWSFSLSISPSNEYSVLISFRTDWFDLLADQGTLKSLLQQHSSKASVLGRSVFFIVQLSHLYMTTGKISFDCTDLCRQKEREWVPIGTNSSQCICVGTEHHCGDHHFSSPETFSGNSKLTSMFPKFKGPAVHSLPRSSSTQSEHGHSSGAAPRRKDK